LVDDTNQNADGRLTADMLFMTQQDEAGSYAYKLIFKKKKNTFEGYWMTLVSDDDLDNFKNCDISAYVGDKTQTISLTINNVNLMNLYKTLA